MSKATASHTFSSLGKPKGEHSDPKGRNKLSRGLLRPLRIVKRKTISVCRGIYSRMGACIFRKADGSRFLSVVYYTLFSRVFYDEMRSVVAGRHAYDSGLFLNNRSAILRRNVHRLEKGLLMQPRRETFATSFIEETVDQFARRVRSDCDSGEKAELDWAGEVLSEYFESVADTDERINRARERFRDIDGNASPNPTPRNRVPYKRDLSGDLPVAYERFRELALLRRSNRWFRKQTVSRAVISKAVEVASQSPSACNRQPYQFYIYDDPELVERIAGIAPGSKGFCHNIPSVAVVVGDLSNYFSEGDRHLIYIDSSLAIMSFIYALETQGVSSCPLNWPDAARLNKRIAGTIGLKPHQRVIMMIGFGYADCEGLVAYSQKKDAAELCIYNAYAKRRGDAD